MAGAPLIVQIHDLHFAYPDGTPALRGVNLSVREGERLALLGPNGAGKSTLLLHLNGLLRGQGEIAICGLSLTSRNLPAIRRHVGLVFQDPADQLFMPTVFDEVAFAALNAGCSRAETERRVQKALAAVGLQGQEKRSPLNLSVGQQKRLAIASVLVTDNRLLVLDEPAAGLDPAGRRALLALLNELSSTLIVATHDLDFACALCARTALMYEGQIVAEGPTEVLLADEDLRRRYGL